MSMNKQRAELAREAEAILLQGGFVSAHAKHLGPFWRVAGELADKNEHSGTTAHQVDPQDPRDLARRLVTLAQPKAEAPAKDGYESAEAIASEQPLFSPEDDPFGLAPSPEAEETLGHEGDGETGETQENASDVSGDRGDRPGLPGEEGLAAPDTDAELSREDDAPVGADDAGAAQSLGDTIDADFTDDSHISSVREQLEAEALPDFTAEMYEAEAEASGSQFIFGDNLYQMRTAAIGLAMQAALARMPAWSDADTARLSELRNFAMGVSEGRWNDDTAIRAELDTLEATLRLRSRVVAHRDALVEFLNAASREEVEGFDPEAGWPA